MLRRLIVPVVLFASVALLSAAGFVDGIVAPDGRILVLTQTSISDLPVNVKSLVGRSFVRYGYQAITFTTEPVLLWFGTSSPTDSATFVSYLNSKRSVELRPALGVVFGLAVNPAGDIYVAGVLGSALGSLVHQYSASGALVRSFHPSLCDSMADVHRLGRSRVVVDGRGMVFVLAPFLSASVSEYAADGKLITDHNYDDTRNTITIFSHQGEVFAQRTVKKPSGAMPPGELVRVRDGSASPLSFGDQLIGLQPDGKAVVRSIGFTNRDAVTVR